MAVDGIRSLYIETHDFAKSAAFWKSLGFVHFLELGATSGGFRAADGIRRSWKLEAAGQQFPDYT